MLQGVDVQVFVAFETHQIVAVSFVIAEEQVLAMYGIYVLPICQRLLYGGKRRMIINLIGNPVGFQPVKGFLYPGAHLRFGMVTVPNGIIESFINLQ